MKHRVSVADGSSVTTRGLILKGKDSPTNFRTRTANDAAPQTGIANCKPDIKLSFRLLSIYIIIRRLSGNRYLIQTVMAGEVHEHEQFDDNDSGKGQITMDAIITRLQGLGADASYTASMLRGSYGAQKSVLEFLRSLGGKQELRIVETDVALLQWLHSCYLFVSSLPTFSSGTALPLTPIMAATGLIQ